MTFISINQEIAIISVSGPDSKIFLQGQLTNDINLADTQNSIFAAHLNNKGRVLATFLVRKIEDNTYYLLTSSVIADSIIPRLKMFVLRSKVSIDVISNKNILFIDNPEQLDANPVQIKAITLDIMHKGKILIIDNGLPPHQEPDDTIKNNTFEWQIFLINNKIPLIYKATEAEFIPQHINYDTLPGISFTKGCYTGQEIVARTHYLGKAKRRMYQFTIPTHVTIGQTVVSPKMNNQIIGIIVETIKQKTTSFGLVSLQCDCIDSAFIDNMQLNIL